MMTQLMYYVILGSEMPVAKGEIGSITVISHNLIFSCKKSLQKRMYSLSWGLKNNFQTRMEFYGVKLVWELRWDWDVFWSFSNLQFVIGNGQ